MRQVRDHRESAPPAAVPGPQDGVAQWRRGKPALCGKGPLGPAERARKADATCQYMFCRYDANTRGPDEIAYSEMTIRSRFLHLISCHHKRKYTPTRPEAENEHRGKRSTVTPPTTPPPPHSPQSRQIIENLDLVAARLSCRKQRDGRRWVVSRAKRVAAESGSLVHRVASRLDGVFYFFKVGAYASVS